MKSDRVDALGIVIGRIQFYWLFKDGA